MAEQLTHTKQTTTDERTWDLAARVIDLARGLIVADNPFLSSAVGMLDPRPATLDEPFACDGKTLFVDAQQLLRAFSQTRTAPAHDLTHVLAHCILLHPFVGASVDGSSWDLAADIVAESLVTEIVGERDGERGARQRDVFRRLSKDLDGHVSTERLYRALRDGAYSETRRKWQGLFHVDDHGLWPSSQAPDQGGGSSAQPQQDDGQDQGGKPPLQSPSMTKAEAKPGDGAQAGEPRDSLGRHGAPADETQGESQDDSLGQSEAKGGSKAQAPLSDAERSRAEEAWSRAAKSMRVDLETLSRTRGSGLNNLMRELSVSSHERVDYREFLRQFAVEHEDMRLSDDEFDYVFYTYGLELYRNMPLIEPLEYRSEKRIRDFVIVIDTSSSVSAKVVQEFVDATFDVLTSEGGFFAKTNIHIIQADARVQSDTKISSLADLDRWRHNIKLRGFGGTDFRPAFRYVQQLRHAGEFDDLQGLVYFTDGWGIYPERMPPYKCAFVFYDEDHRPDLVPPWAIQVTMHPGAFESMSVY